MNLYVHFPFCRRKCTYCALHSRAGAGYDTRSKYVKTVTKAVCALKGKFSTVYFGGGTPAMCELSPLMDAVSPLLTPDCEWTVELHPLDISDDLLKNLKAHGVNRISMGIQSLDDEILRHMGRGYGFYEAERAFDRVHEYFDNAGIDLIVGYPGEKSALTPRHARLAKWHLAHCSVYSLIHEDKAILSKMKIDEIDDETVMNRISVLSRFMSDIGLERYEISNYAALGRECRHNLAVWNGEDYVGIGEGAYGRIGLRRTRDSGMASATEEIVDELTDRKERTIFRLRTKSGLDASSFPEWKPALNKFVKENLLRRSGNSYILTERGTEVCDTILSEIV